jgi:hypothetical protein
MNDTEVKRYCDKCGAQLRADSSYCPKCGSEQVAVPSQPADWRVERREWRAQRREERYGRPGPHYGGLIIATILVVAGLGIFFPELPWEAFWGSLLIILGAWIGFLWFERGHSRAAVQPR